MLNRSPWLATFSHSLPKINHWTDFERIAPIDSKSSSDAVGRRTLLACIRHEEDFRLDTKDFVDKLFDVIRSRRYIPEGKKVRASCERDYHVVYARVRRTFNRPRAISNWNLPRLSKHRLRRPSPDETKVRRRNPVPYLQSHPLSRSSSR